MSYSSTSTLYRSLVCIVDAAILFSFPFGICLNWLPKLGKHSSEFCEHWFELKLKVLNQALGTISVCTAAKLFSLIVFFCCNNLAINQHFSMRPHCCGWGATGDSDRSESRLEVYITISTNVWMVAKHVLRRNMSHLSIIIINVYDWFHTEWS